MAPFNDIAQPTLEFALKVEINLSDPVVIPSGPRGARYLYTILGGTFEGADEDFHGEIISPSADLVVGHSDGSGHSLKVHVTMRNHDGATLLGLVEGRAELDPNNSANAKQHSSMTFETGDERFKWMNNKVFVGYGKKEGKTIRLNGYKVV